MAISFLVGSVIRMYTMSNRCCLLYVFL